MQAVPEADHVGCRTGFFLIKKELMEDRGWGRGGLSGCFSTLHRYFLLKWFFYYLSLNILARNR